MACLETTFLIDILNGKEEIIKLREELEKTEVRLTIAAPSITEIWFGALFSKKSEKEKNKIRGLISSLEILPLDLSSAEEAAEIEAELTRQGNRIGTEDIMIAAIAKVNGEKLVTRDQHFARIPGLRVLKY